MLSRIILKPLTFYYDPTSLVDISLFVAEQLMPLSYFLRLVYKESRVSCDYFYREILEIIRYKFVDDMLCLFVTQAV